MSKEKGKSLVESMKERISRTGSAKGCTFYLKKDAKCRIRFLQDMEDGVTVTFHDKWGEFNHPCLKYYGKKCPNCKNKEARTADNYVWSVWNYETKRVELFMYKANKCSPIPALISMFETYGTICDRDYVIQKNGDGTDTNYSVVPMDKSKFTKDEEPFSEKQIFKMLLEAFPYDSDIDEDDEDEEEEEEEVAPKKSKKARKVVEEDEDEDEDEDDFDDEEDEDEDETPKKKSSKLKEGRKTFGKGYDGNGFDDDEDEVEEDEEDEQPKKKSKRK